MTTDVKRNQKIALVVLALLVAAYGVSRWLDYRQEQVELREAACKAAGYNAARAWNRYYAGLVIHYMKEALEHTRNEDHKAADAIEARVKELEDTRPKADYVSLKSLDKLEEIIAKSPKSKEPPDLAALRKAFDACEPPP